MEEFLVDGVSDTRGTEIHTFEPLVPEPSFFLGWTPYWKVEKI